MCSGRYSCADMSCDHVSAYSLKQLIFSQIFCVVFLMHAMLLLAKQSCKHYFDFLEKISCLSWLIACFFSSYRVKDAARRQGRAQFQWSWNVCHRKYNCWISEEYRQGNHKDPGTSWSRFHYQGGMCVATKLLRYCKYVQQSRRLSVRL